MATNPETGHAKNIANLHTLNLKISTITASYKPANKKIEADKLVTLFDTCDAAQKKVLDLIPPYSTAVDNRAAFFKTFGKQFSGLGRAYKATEDITPELKDEFASLSRMYRGTSLTAKDEKSHSTAHTSYDMRVETTTKTISLLKNTPKYNPTEKEFTVANIETIKTEMQRLNDEVTKAHDPLSAARDERNALMYLDTNNMIYLANQARDYMLSITKKDSSTYKDVMKLKFIKH